MIKRLRAGVALGCVTLFLQGVADLRAAELVNPVDFGFFYAQDTSIDGAKRQTAVGPFYSI